jgi:crotonobetaine/carnitine-CoA ligase
VSGFWPEIERSGARVAMVLASMIPLIAAAPDTPAMQRCFGQLHSVWGLPFPPEIRAVWRERFGVKWINCYGYGMTEGGKIFTVLPGDTLPPEGSQGRLSDEFEAMIADDADRELPPGAIGEILFRPKLPNIMFSGYWKRPEATAETWRNLWMHTGDLGRIDENGFFSFVGRKKDSIRRRGENISTHECEIVLARHPAIKEVAVHAVPSPLGEDDVKLTAVLKEDASVSERELCAWCIDNFPAFAVPRYYEFRDEIPKTSTGKPMKYALTAEGRTARTWDREESELRTQRKSGAKA